MNITVVMKEIEVIRARSIRTDWPVAPMWSEPLSDVDATDSATDKSATINNPLTDSETF